MMSDEFGKTFCSDGLEFTFSSCRFLFSSSIQLKRGVGLLSRGKTDEQTDKSSRMVVSLVGWDLNTDDFLGT